MRRPRPFALVAVAAALVAIVITAYVTTAADQRRRDDVARDDAARDAALALEAFLDGVESQVAWLVRPGAATPAADTAYILARVPAVTRLQFIDGRGRLTYTATRAGFAAADADASHTRAFIAADPGSSWVSPVGRPDGRPHADLAVTRSTDSGVAVADLDLSFVGDVLDAVHAPPGTRLTLSDDAGTPIAGTTGPGESSAIPIPRANWILRASGETGARPALLPLAERVLALMALLAAITWSWRRFGRRP